MLDYIKTLIEAHKLAALLVVLALVALFVIGYKLSIGLAVAAGLVYIAKKMMGGGDGTATAPVTAPASA